jgi:ketosteroid isomerase-like protein
MMRPSQCSPLSRLIFRVAPPARPWMAAMAVLVAALSTPAPAAAYTIAECAVWARELGFADSVARHDAEAFAEHVEPGAVFGAGGDARTRGRDAIVDRWRQIIEGRRVTIEWYPTQTTVGGVDGIAWSEGPALVITDPGTPRAAYRLGRFRSVWRRGEDGTWRVLFDDGDEARPATPEEVRAFRAGRRDTCPHGGSAR